MSELKVLVSDSFAFASDQVAVAIIRQQSHDMRWILHFSEQGFEQWDPIDPGQMISERPTFVLNNDVARAVLEAFLRHYQGASDMHTVRQDLLHERGRVDRLITVVSDNLDKAVSLLGGE